jgi:hypothetical protein
VGPRERLLRGGPAALSAGDHLALLRDVDSMNALHDGLWSTPAAQLAEWWQLALRHYGVMAPAPATAFSPKDSVNRRRDSAEFQLGVVFAAVVEQRNGRAWVALAVERQLSRVG